MVLNIVNSTFGRSSNIAYRTSKIVSALKERDIAYEVYCRESEITDLHVHAIVPGGDFIPRLMNAVRFYLFNNFPSRLMDNRQFGFWAKRALKEVRIEQVKLVHLWEPLPELMDYFHRRQIPVLLEVPIAPTFYGKALCERGLSTGPGKIHPEYERTENASFQNADHILVPSDFVKSLLVEKGIEPEKITTLPFGCDPIEGSIDYPNRGPLAFGFAGTVNLRKGVSFLLDAWSDSQFQSDSLHLCGHVAPDIRSRLNEGVFSNVITPGFVRSRDYLKQCHVYVFPSLMEGSSKSIYEAMSLGMPIITTEAAGSLVTDGKEGFLVQAGNSAELKSAMLKFKSDPTLVRRMGMAARAKVAEYPWSRYAHSVADLYQRLMP